MTAADRPSVTDNARADLHPVVTEHQIIGTQTGKQGAGQVVPEDSVLCIKCGWMRCSDYTWHLSDALAAGRAETITATDEDAAQVIDALTSSIGYGYMPTADRDAWAARLATARTRPTDPTDAQVLAALNAMHPRAAAPSLDYWTGKADEMRTALRAAWTEADQWTFRDKETP